MLHPIFAAWDGLHHTLYTGEPGFQKVFGAPVFNYIVAHPELGPLFDAGMTSMNFHETGAMLDAYDFNGVNILADIGGGNAPSAAKNYNMLMLVYPGGRERSEEEFGELCKASGFELASITPTTTMISVFTARPV